MEECLLIHDMQAAILADNECDLQKVLSNIVKVCKSFGMEFNERRQKLSLLKRKRKQLPTEVITTYNLSKCKITSIWVPI